MNEITVPKDQLLEKLKQNRDDHRAIFEEALEGFRVEVITELEARLADVRTGKRYDVRVSKAVPQDHTSDYKRAIAMIEMAIGDTIVLTEEDFAQYVMDDWGWQRAFLSNVYGSRTAIGKFSDSYAVS